MAEGFAQIKKSAQDTQQMHEEVYGREGFFYPATAQNTGHRDMNKTGDIKPFFAGQTESANKAKFNAYWIRDYNTASYNYVDLPAKQFFTGKDKWSGSAWDVWHKDAKDVTVKGNKVIFSGEYGKEYFKMEDLIRNPSQGADWRAGLRNSSFTQKSIPKMVEALTSGDVKAGSQMNKAIVEDILKCVPLKYLQGKGEESVTDKLELAKSLTTKQVQKILEYYTFNVPVEKEGKSKEPKTRTMTPDIESQFYKELNKAFGDSVKVEIEIINPNKGQK